MTNNSESKIVIPMHPVHAIRNPHEPSKPYFGDLALIRTLPDGRRGCVRTSPPGDSRSSKKDAMEIAYDYLIGQRNAWIHNGHEENFNAVWEIIPLYIWHNKEYKEVV